MSEFRRKKYPAWKLLSNAITPSIEKSGFVRDHVWNRNNECCEENVCPIPPYITLEVSGYSLKEISPNPGHFEYQPFTYGLLIRRLQTGSPPQNHCCTMWAEKSLFMDVVQFPLAVHVWGRLVTITFQSCEKWTSSMPFGIAVLGGVHAQTWILVPLLSGMPPLSSLP